MVVVVVVVDGDESYDLFVYPIVEQQLLFDLGAEGEMDVDVRAEDADVWLGELVVEIFASLPEEKVVEDEEEAEELSIDGDQGWGDLPVTKSEVKQMLTSRETHGLELYCIEAEEADGIERRRRL